MRYVLGYVEIVALLHMFVDLFHDLQIETEDVCELAFWKVWVPHHLVQDCGANETEFLNCDLHFLAEKFILVCEELIIPICPQNAL